MSTCFEIYPTDNNIPEFHKIIEKAELMFCNFLRKYNVETNIDITISEVTENNEIKVNPEFIVGDEKLYDIITVNNVGNIYIFYYELSDIDNEIWNDELKTNQRAVSLKDSIMLNRNIGHFWCIKRTSGQPVIISLLYGFIAMAVSAEANGFIYSADGAWSYNEMPLKWEKLYAQYMNVDNIDDADMKYNLINWITLLKTIS